MSAMGRKRTLHSLAPAADSGLASVPNGSADKRFWNNMTALRFIASPQWWLTPELSGWWPVLPLGRVVRSFAKNLKCASRASRCKQCNKGAPSELEEWPCATH